MDSSMPMPGGNQKVDVSESPEEALNEMLNGSDPHEEEIACESEEVLKEDNKDLSSDPHEVEESIEGPKDLPSDEDDENPKPFKQPDRIEVIANKKGIYARERKVSGDRFFVKHKELGSWMDCVDKVLQKKHLEAQKEKKQKRAGK